MIFAVATILLLLLAYGPNLWVRFVMHRHGKENADIPGTGGELATHLLKRYELDHVAVEECADYKDHYDPESQTVRLGSRNFNGRSLTAVAVAAHEVGHAIQFHRKEALSELRSRYLPMAMLLKRIGVGMIVLLPIVGLLFKSPVAVFGFFGLCVACQLLGALSYLIILPEEWDASFNKALPILEEGSYISERELPAVRSVLKAAALTYFAGALADVVNVGRWIFVLLRR